MIVRYSASKNDSPSRIWKPTVPPTTRISGTSSVRSSRLRDKMLLRRSGMRDEREETPAGGLIERGAIFARLEGFGVVDAASAPRAVILDEQVAEAVRLPAQAVADLLAQPLLASRLRVRHLVGHAAVVRQPFIELRRVAMQ